MIGRILLWGADANGLIQAAVGAKDVVTSRAEEGALPDLEPGVEAPVSVSLSEMY